MFSCSPVAKKQSSCSSALTDGIDDLVMQKHLVLDAEACKQGRRMSSDKACSSWTVQVQSLPSPAEVFTRNSAGLCSGQMAPFLVSAASDTATCPAVLACMSVLQVVKLEKLANGNWTCTLYDGSSSLPGRFTTQVSMWTSTCLCLLFSSKLQAAVCSPWTVTQQMMLSTSWWQLLAASVCCCLVQHSSCSYKQRTRPCRAYAHTAHHYLGLAAAW